MILASCTNGELFNICGTDWNDLKVGEIIRKNFICRDVHFRISNPRNRFRFSIWFICEERLRVINLFRHFRRASQQCFWLLAFISRPQVRNIHLPGQMILSGSLIPSDKYFLKNLTFVVRSPLVWLRLHSSQTLYVARKMNVSYVRAADEG